jgi:hypothetical protein
MLTNFLPLGRVFSKEGASMLQELLKCVVCRGHCTDAQDWHCPGDPVSNKLLHILGSQHWNLQHLLRNPWLLGYSCFRTC